MEMDAPGLVVPPPMIFLPAVVLGFVLDQLWPVELLSPLVEYVIGGLLIMISLSVVPWVLREFRKANTHFDARKPVNALITTGPFRISRNPSYVALAMLCLGVAVIADTLWILICLLPACIFLDVAIIQREERFLERKFGNTYVEYTSQVRRWL